MNGSSLRFDCKILKRLFTKSWVYLCGMFVRKSLKFGSIAVFAAFHSALYLPPGPWRSWAIYLEPIEGIILGPFAGFFAALIGSCIARMIKPDIFWMFGVIAEPLGVLVSGFLAKGRWKPVMIIYVVMITAYFMHPYGRMLPLWTILDILFALVLVYPVAKLGKWVFEENVKRLSRALVLISFVSTVADSLTRVFLLVPVGLYTFFGWSFNVLCYAWFIPGAIGSYIEDLIVVTISVAIGVPLLIALRKIPTFNYPLT